MSTVRSVLPGPENIFQHTLPNGITLLIRENPFSKAVAMRSYLPCGSYLDPVGKTGLSTFVSGCLSYGTADHSFTQIHEILENSGALLSFNSGVNTVGVKARCLAEDLPMIFRMMFEILDRPVFPEQFVEVLRQRALTACELRNHDPEDLSSTRFDELLFGSAHPYGAVSGGTEETIRAISREDMVRFHQNYFGPKGMVITISGGINAEKTFEEAAAVFGGWQKPQIAVNPDDFYPQIPAAHSERKHFEIPEKSEMNLIIGTFGPNYSSEDFYPATIGNCILGEFGMMGRIGKSVRDDNGLAYYAGSSMNSLARSGIWSVSAGVNPQNVEKAIDLIRQELQRFTSEPVTEEELSDVQSFLIGSQPLSLESNAGVANAMMMMELYQLGLDYYLNLEKNIRAVTREQILHTAQTWLNPERLLTVTAGTANENAEDPE